MPNRIPERESETELLDSDEKFRALVEHAVVGIYIIQNGIFSYVNNRLAEIFGYERDELIGQSNTALTHPDDRELAERNVQKRMNGEAESIEYSFRGVTKSGEIKFLRVYGSAFFYRGERAIIGTLIDETETVMAKRKLEKLANYDNLTGLYNRHLFQKEFTRVLELGRRHGRKVALILFDIDNFKRINDSLGHNTGDRLLQEVARRVRDTLRRFDFFARIGGDEFAIILEDYRNHDEIAAMVARMQGAMKEAFELDGLALHVSISLGIALFPEHGEDTESLQKAADIALYEAKHRGRNRFVFFAPDRAGTRLDLTIENDLVRAVEEGRLSLHLQPLVSPQSGRMCGAEALVRWRHPEKGIMAPDDFLPLARELGILYRIDRQVVERAFALLAEWESAGYSLPSLSVNVSSALFHHPQFLATMAGLARRFATLVRHLELELTEEILIEDARHAHQLIKALKSYGYGLAIDDFGTGYSSLGHLKTLEVDKLKIDRTFIRDIPESANDLAIVESIVVMGHTLGLKIVAEGVENASQAKSLTAMGCDMIQGYYYARPLPAERFGQEWLAKGR